MAITESCPLLRAKRALEQMIFQGQTYVALPTVQDVETVVRLMESLSIRAVQHGAPETVDVKAIRDGIGLTQEESALRFGLASTPCRIGKADVASQTAPRAAISPSSRANPEASGKRCGPRRTAPDRTRLQPVRSPNRSTRSFSLSISSSMKRP
jgi:hypothetical protein